jgi:protein-disulfide isomerase
MASLAKQKEEARARRLAEEQARILQARRQRRLRKLGTILGVAVVVVIIAVAVSSGGGSSATPGTSAAKKADAAVNSLLAGIPQSGATLGSPNAKVTVTEFADLQCPICKAFSQGAERQLISQDVRSGKVKLIYRSLSTATHNGPDPNVFPTQQAAALAAGEQRKAWHYIGLFYEEQGQEGTSYVTTTFLRNIAHQVSGLDFTKWNSDRTSQSLIDQVDKDQQEAASKGFKSTPTIVISGPRGTATPLVGTVSYSALEQQITSVS